MLGNYQEIQGKNKVEINQFILKGILIIIIVIIGI